MKQITDYLNYNAEAVIIGNGEYPIHAIPQRILREAPMVVCCDGGANEYIRQGHTPHLIIGDGDSLNEVYRLKHQEIILRVTDQETNDQTKAVTHLLANGVKQIAIVGATGKREDHTLGNISLLMEYRRAGAEVRMFTDYGVFIPCKDCCTLHCRPGLQVSIFNFGATELRSEGLRYPIYDFSLWWQGTLNECSEEHFSIFAKGEYLLFITYETK